MKAKSVANVTRTVHAVRATLIAVVLAMLAAGAGYAGDAPKKAVCRACEVRGAGHGEEKVVASRTYEGRDYHFCAQACAEAFDGFPRAYAVLPLPRPAPEVTLAAMSGGEISLARAEGELTLVDFWATWCAPCVKSMPKLAELNREYGEAGLSIVAVSIDEKRKTVEKFLEKKPLDYAVAIDSKEEPAWHAFAVAAIPALFLIDGEGQIVGEWRGHVEMDDVRRHVEARLASR